MRQAITNLSTNVTNKDFNFYNQVIKKELYENNPDLYKLILSKETKLNHSSYGVKERRNAAGMTSVMKDTD